MSHLGILSFAFTSQNGSIAIPISGSMIETVLVISGVVLGLYLFPSLIRTLQIKQFFEDKNLVRGGFALSMSGIFAAKILLLISYLGALISGSALICVNHFGEGTVEMIFFGTITPLVGWTCYKGVKFSKLLKLSGLLQ